MHSINIPQRLSLLTLIILMCVATQAFAKAGDLDTTFANKGIFATSNNLSTANAVAIQSDGKIVVAGTGVVDTNVFTDMLFRLNTDGRLDSTFGQGGIVNLQPTSIVFGFFALAIQSDGKIVASGTGAFNGKQPVMQVARVNTDGSLDSSFGSGGFTTPIVFPIEGGNLALQPDGKILVAAGVFNPNGVPSEMARFTASGQPDTAFGNGAGVVNLAYQSPTQIAVQADGKILVASGDPSRLVFQATPAAQPGAITRYNSNGTVDKSFGSAGTTASLASASALVLQSDGKIVVAGSLTSKVNSAPSSNDVGFGVARFNSKGVLDRSFGAAGVATVDFGVNTPVSGAFALAIQSNGDLVAGGAATGPSGNFIVSSFGLTRITSAGKIDTTFGKNGRVVTTVASGQYSWINSLAIQSDGKIVAAGTSQFSNSNDNAYVARYLAQ